MGEEKLKWLKVSKRICTFKAAMQALRLGTSIFCVPFAPSTNFNRIQYSCQKGNNS